MKVDPSEEGPSVLLLTFDKVIDFKFKINVTAVRSDDIIAFKSPSVCGIKNEVPARRSHLGVKSSSPVHEKTTGELPAEVSQSSEATEANQGTEESEDKNCQSSRTQPLVTKRKILNVLKEKNHLYSKALAHGIKTNQLKVKRGHTRIVGKEAGVGEWPWMVVIEKEMYYFPPGGPPYSLPCSGVLVDESHVVTSATCVLYYTGMMAVPVSGLKVLLGIHDIRSPNLNTTVTRSVERATFPLTVSPLTLKDDLAVLELTEAVAYTKFIRPLCLPVDCK
ncbi:hypothetical protein SK128_005281 [Halocaridina rubra]|uniref:Peptidase S1 domain-containing protein n=1 Tax=Halocaridina rubra TaxID=373956 RepID=A0AAN8WSK6_HALRR